LPKQSPIPDESDKVFWDACNEGKQLLVQNCKACNRLQYPPEPACPACGKADNLEWKPVSGRGTIHSYAVIYDSPIKTMQAEQPYNTAVISLEEDPGVLFLSNLPGTPVDQVSIGSKVQVIFETTPATGQKVPEWQVVG
jgi:uncharacterized OB-fold protein